MQISETLSYQISAKSVEGFMWYMYQSLFEDLCKVGFIMD
jgi:hypothetical protein